VEVVVGGVWLPVFTIGGKAYRVNMDEVITALRNVEPEPVRRYYVVINGRSYPIKQVISVALNIPRIAFTSMDAYRILRRLGFEIHQR